MSPTCCVPCRTARRISIGAGAIAPNRKATNQAISRSTRDPAVAWRHLVTVVARESTQGRHSIRSSSSGSSRALAQENDPIGGAARAGQEPVVRRRRRQTPDSRLNPRSRNLKRVSQAARGGRRSLSDSLGPGRGHRARHLHVSVLLFRQQRRCNKHQRQRLGAV